MEFSQFILEFPILEDHSFDSFVAMEKNRLIVEAIKQMANRPQHALTIIGAAGVGKTHLLQAAVNHFTAQNPQLQPTALYLDINALVGQLPNRDEASLAGVLQEYGDHPLVAVDDLQLLEGRPDLQEALLFLFNRLRATGGRGLFASRMNPQGMAWLREDLRSRLLWGEVFTLQTPSDDELGEILAKMARDRQVRLSPELIKFLKLRLPRRVPDYADAMARLDRAGMGLKHKLTVPLAKKVLDM